MPAAARLNDPDNSDGAITTGCSTTVFIDGQPAAVVGCMDRDHAPYGPPHPPHVPNPIVTGSSVVFIDGKPAARVGDQFQCGHVVASGSPTVNIE